MSTLNFSPVSNRHDDVLRKSCFSFPIPLRILFAAHPELLTPLLRIVHRVIARLLVKQAGLKRDAADTGTVTWMRRFGSAADLLMQSKYAQRTSDRLRRTGSLVWPTNPHPESVSLRPSSAQDHSFASLTNSSVINLVCRIPRQSSISCQ